MEHSYNHKAKNRLNYDTSSNSLLKNQITKQIVKSTIKKCGIRGGISNLIYHRLNRGLGE